MATSGSDKKYRYRTWSVNDKFKVSVNKENPDYTKAKVQFQCFNTIKDNIGIKADERSGTTIVQFPVPQVIDSHSRSTLKETFRKCMIDFVTKDKSYVLIPIDNIRYWTKRGFCEVILEEFTELAGNQKTKLNHPVKLEFCTLEDLNFGEAVKACEAQIKEVRSEPVVQKNRKSLGPSICIVKNSLANVKVDVITCTTSHDFDLSRGAVSAALLRQGGNNLQRELYKKCGGAQNFGEVIPVSGHKLDCRVVFFGVMYPYDPKYAKGYKTAEEYYRINIHDFVQKSLNLAEKRQLRSVAFPAIGAGVLKYPIDIVADEMFRTVDDWRGTFVKEVKFVIYPKDTVVLQEFLKKYVNSHWCDSQRLMYCTHPSAGASIVPSSVIHHSGTIRTSQFYSDSQLGLPKVECKFPLPKGYTTEFIEMCCFDVIENLKKCYCDVLFTKHELIIKFTLETLDIGQARITDVLRNMQIEYPSCDFLDLTEAKFNKDDVKKKIKEIEKNSKVRCSVSNNGTLVSFYGKIVQDVKDAKDKIVSLLLSPKGNSKQNSPWDNKDAGFEFVPYPKNTAYLQEFEIEKKYDHSRQANETGQTLNSRFLTQRPNPSAGKSKDFERAKYDQPLLFYDSANETGQTWNSRFLTPSLNPSAGRPKSSNMSESSKEKSYEVMKVGKFWLLGRSGGKLKVCPLLTNAEEVDKSNNFIAADDKVYEIKEDEFEQVYLVSVEETPIYNQHNSNREPSQSRQGESSSPSLISQRRSRGWFQSHQQETLSQYANELNEMTITDETETRRNEDQYYLFEAGQTEDSSFIEVGFPAKK